MKKIKGKYIRVTESQLQEIVKNEVNKQLSVLLEYAIPRSKFVENAYNMSDQIIENWCLAHYCTITGRSQLKEHWKGELYVHMNNVSKKVIKANNTYDIRLKAITEGFDWNNLFDGAERINRLICVKFKTEGIDMTTKEYEQCVGDCFNSLQEIIDVMARFDPLSIEEYIGKI